jgi:hypothetical protein
MPLFVLCSLTFVIHLVGTLAYAVRIAGVRTGRIAVSFALFNVLILVSRTSNTFQGPFLAKRVEQGISAAGSGSSILSDMRWLLLAATAATLVGAVFIPTFQRWFSRAVQHFHVHRSMSRLLLHTLTGGGMANLREDVRVPARQNLTGLSQGTGLSPAVVIANAAAMALWTVGVFAALYAGTVKPELRVTCSNLSSVINGVATILMFAFIDPQLSVMTDDVTEGRVSEGTFRRAITTLVGARLVGTVLAQMLLVPSALAVVAVAERL